MSDAALRLSRQLQPLAQGLAEAMRDIAGQDVSFVLLAAPDRNVQYVANCNRNDGITIIRGLLERWGNPAVPDLPQLQKEEMLLELLAACKNLHHALDMAFALLIEASHGKAAEPFFPSRSPMWPAVVASKETVDRIEARLRFAETLADEGPMSVPAPEERH